MAAWFDEVRTCVGWDEGDQTRIGDLKGWLKPDAEEVVGGLAGQLARIKGAEALMANSRFVRRLHGTLHEWLTGLLNGTFGDPYVERRRAFGQRLLDFDLTFEDVTLLGRLIHRRVAAYARARLRDDPAAFSTMVYTLDKALDIDMACICSSYLKVRDAEMEELLLGRFLSITGFSRTLYETLSEASAADILSVR